MSRMWRKLTSKRWRKAFLARSWKTINAPIAVSLFSVISVAFVSWAYPEMTERRQKDRQILKLKGEVDFRLRLLHRELVIGGTESACEVLDAFHLAPRSLGRKKSTAARPDDIFLSESLKGWSLLSILRDLELVRNGSVESKVAPLDAESSQAAGGSADWPVYSMRTCSESRLEAKIFCEIDMLDAKCRVFGEGESPLAREEVKKVMESLFKEVERIPNGL